MYVSDSSLSWFGFICIAAIVERNSLFLIAALSGVMTQQN